MPRAPTRAAGRRGSRRSPGGERGRGADSREFLGPYRSGDPGPVQDASFVGFGDEVFGLVVVAVCCLHRPEVDRDTVFLGRHQTGQEVAVTGDQHHIRAGAISGQFSELCMHRGVDALLGPPSVAPGERAQPDGDPGHHPQPAVFGLWDAVGGAVEPVDAEQGAFRIGLGEFTQALDESGVIDGDPGTRWFTGEQARSGTEQVAGVHQHNAAVHALHPLSHTPRSRGPRILGDLGVLRS